MKIAPDYKNWAQIFDKSDPKKQKHRYELMPNTKLGIDLKYSYEMI